MLRVDGVIAMDDWRRWSMANNFEESPDWLIALIEKVFEEFRNGGPVLISDTSISNELELTNWFSGFFGRIGELRFSAGACVEAMHRLDLSGEQDSVWFLLFSILERIPQALWLREDWREELSKGSAEVLGILG